MRTGGAEFPSVAQAYLVMCGRCVIELVVNGRLDKIDFQVIADGSSGIDCGVSWFWSLCKDHEGDESIV